MQQEHGLNENDGTSLKRNEKNWSEREGGGRSLYARDIESIVADRMAC